MIGQQARKRLRAAAGLPPDDYEPDLREGDTVRVCEIAGQPPQEAHYIALVIDVVEHGYYLLVECRLESGDARRFRTYRDGPPEAGVISVKILRRVDRPREPEREYRQLYSKQDRVRPTGRPEAEQIVPGARFRVDLDDGYYTTIRILTANGRGWTAINMATEQVIEISDRRRLRKLERCPQCGASDLYEMPAAGWPCTACRARRVSH